MNEHSFGIHPIEGYISTLYLVNHGEDYLLLDGGCSCDFKRVKAYLESNGKSLENLKLVVVTHMHPDHAGGVKHFQNEGIPVASTEGAFRWYRGFGGFLQHKVDTFLAQFSARRKKRTLEPVNYKRKFKPDFTLNESDFLPFFPEWKVVKTPGHTLYDICLYNEKRKIGYIADVVLKMERKFVLPFPVLFPELMKKSLEKLSIFDFEKILLAHGGIVEKNETGGDFKAFFLEMRGKVGEKLVPQFRLFYPFCILVHDKWICKFKACE